MSFLFLFYSVDKVQRKVSVTTRSKAKFIRFSLIFAILQP